jgi:hypothetical protein
LSTPQLLLTTIRFLGPVVFNALMRFSGMPHKPNPARDSVISITDTCMSGGKEKVTYVSAPAVKQYVKNFLNTVNQSAVTLNDTSQITDWGD